MEQMVVLSKVLTATLYSYQLQEVVKVRNHKQKALLVITGQALYAHTILVMLVFFHLAKVNIQRIGMVVEDMVIAFEQL